MAATTRDRDKERKISKGKENHRTKQMRVHFHKNGEICPSTFGEDCPNDSDWDGSEEGEAYEGNLSIQDFISQLGARGVSPGQDYQRFLIFWIFKANEIYDIFIKTMSN